MTNGAGVTVGAATSGVLNSDGILTALHDFGGVGPIVLFVHATGMHGKVWKPVADHLIDDARCVAVDLRGHGDTPLPTGWDAAWQGFGQDVLAAAGSLGGAEVIGVGHSLGGAALVMAELARPGTFRHLFLYEPALHPGAWCATDPELALRDVMVEMASRRRSTFTSRAAALSHYVRRPPMAQFQAAVLDAYVSHGFADIDSEDGSGVALKCAPDTEARTYAGSYEDPSMTRLQALTCPVTLAFGSETGAIHRRAMEALASQLGSAPVVLPDVDHFGPMQQPGPFAAAVARHVLDG
jgi:pimeloyl-ACP methyl ester carboxylesterase